MPIETGKHRSQRIDLNYYRHRGWLFWWRWACIAIGTIGGGVYALCILAGNLPSSSSQSTQASAGFDTSSHINTGLLARPHEHFESQCGQCHDDFTPISGDASTLSSGQPLKPLFEHFGVGLASATESVKRKCNACHQVSGHHHDVLTDSAKNVDDHCAGCHADHQGRDHDLASVSNRKCVQCHSETAQHIDTNVSRRRGELDKTASEFAPQANLDVTAFSLAAHPPFRSLPSAEKELHDHGRLRFDHSQHMIAGQPHGRPDVAKKLSALSGQDQARYRAAKDSGLVQLVCTDCHQMAGAAKQDSSLAADSKLGRFMEPVSFEQHCQACHRINPPAATTDTLPLPHAAPWKEIDLQLAARIVGSRATGTIRKSDDDTNPHPVVGTGTQASINLSSKVERTEIELARLDVVAECRKCHGREFDFQGSDDETPDPILSAIANQRAPMVPRRWLKHGVYDHAAHGGIDCKYCHAAAFEEMPFPGSTPNPSLPSASRQVMISNIDKCVDCHRDASQPTPPSLLDTNGNPKDILGGLPTWASTDCTQCHHYHLAVPRMNRAAHHPWSGHSARSDAVIGNPKGLDRETAEVAP